MPSALNLPLEALKSYFGDSTFARGTAYARAGRVLEVHVNHGGGVVQVGGEVAGSTQWHYDVEISIRHSGDASLLTSRCTCPMRSDCKHVVAVLLEVRGEPGPVSWTDKLERALDSLRGGEGDSSGVALGLLVDLKVLTMGRAEPSHNITLRPVRQGVKSAWIKQGVSWYDIRYGWRAGQEFIPEQWQALRDLSATFQPNHSKQNPDLAAFGATLWPLLRKALDAGIALVPGTGVAEVELLSGGLTPAVDLREEGDELAVRAGLADAQGRLLEVGRASINFLGDPGHGVVLLEEIEPRARTSGRHFEIRLAELAVGVPGPLQELIWEPDLRIPEADRRLFTSEFLPKLRKQLPTSSSDSSVALPEPLRPHLCAEVAWSPSHEARLSWWWVYRDPAEAQAVARIGLHSHEGLRDFRDPAEERALLGRAGLDAHVPVVAGMPAAEQVYRGLDLLAFVAETLPALRALDEVEIEEVGQQPDYRAAIEGPEISFELRDPTDDGTDWLDLEVAVRIDGEGVPLGSVLAALTLGDPVIFTPSGRHVLSTHPSLTHLAELVAAAGDIVDQPDGSVRVGKADVAMWGELESLGVVDAQAEEWVCASRALRDFEGLPEVAVSGLKTELRSYQESGLRWLAFMWGAGLGAVLADDMGLGKTVQALGLVAHARENGAAPFLVIAPTSVVGAWEQQAALHTPGLRVKTVLASAKKRGTTLPDAVAEADIVVTSYTLFRLEAAAYRELGWGGLILDEAHTIKNHLGRTYQEVRRLDVPFRLALTGTPFENRLMEMWSLLSVVAPGLYPKPGKFVEVVVTPVEKYGSEVALERFRRRVRPFLLRRTKDLVAADLPPKQENVLTVALPPKHRRIYDTHLQRERQTVMGLIDDFDHQRIAIFRALTRLRQLSLDPGLVDEAYASIGSAKLEALVAHLHELIGEGHRALVFSQFTSYLARVRDRLDREGIEYVYLDGSTSNRPRVIDSFKNGTAPVFLISLKAGGVGLTLTEADYVFVLDPWWNPAIEAQAVDRAHRIGQERPVMVYRLVAEGTIEEKVMELKARKEALFGQVIDGDGLMSTEITAADVQGLFGA